MSTTPALAYLELIRQHIDSVRADVPKLTAFGEAMASRFSGGRLFTPKVGPFWPSEFMNRAGGLMGIEPADAVPDREGDVAFIALPDERKWKPAEDAVFQQIVKSPAKIFAIGREADLPAGVDAKRFSGFTGGVRRERRTLHQRKLKPLARCGGSPRLVRAGSRAGK